MSDPQSSGNVPRDQAESMHSALFAQLILQQANMASMLLGKVPHPQSGEVMKDLDGARMFIDLLEMLEAKTKGNLTKEETALLKQSLMSLRMAYVEAVQSPSPEKASPEPAKPAPSEPAAEPSASEEEHRKKFSKKY
jgi:hypothetical protein